MFNNIIVHFPGVGVPYRELLLVGAIGVFVTYIFTALIRPIAINLRAVTQFRSRDVHTQPRPRWGGIAVYIGVVSALLVAAQLPALTRGFLYSSEIPSVIVGGGVILILGAIDDRWDLGAFTKLIGQIVAACIVVLYGVTWYIIYVPSVGTVVLDYLQAGILTVLVIATMANAVNFIDGLDGLVAGVAAISSADIVLFSVSLLAKNDGDVSYYPPALIAIVLCGSCIGFLPHNFFPSRIILGDSGALFIGLVLATASISVGGRVAMSSFGVADFISLLSPLLLTVVVSAIPMFDLCSTVFRRLMQGRKIFSSDKFHTHHQLLELGHSHRKAVLVFYLWSCVLSLIVATIRLVVPWIEALIIVIGGGCALIVTFGSRLLPKGVKNIFNNKVTDNIGSL